MKQNISMLFSILLLAAGSLSAFTPEWDDSVILEKDARQNAYWLKSGDRKKFYGGIMGKRHIDFSKVKAWIRDQRIHVDLTDAFLKENGFIDISFRIPLDKVDRTVPTQFIMEIGGTPGLSGDIGLNGIDKQKKHYWNNKPFLITEDKEPFAYEKQIPESVARLDLIARMRKPGIYTFGQSRFSKKNAEEEQIDPARNLIVNGGAERGWYSTGVRNMLNHTDGTEYSPFWAKNVYRYPLLAEIDSREKVSGNASFKFTVRHDKPNIDSDSHYIMHFNQVPILMGKPALLTLWMKADKPGRKALIRLHFAPGEGWYGMNAAVGPEWKKYQLRIPSMGGKPANGWLAGNLKNQTYKLLTPRIEFRTPGTFWIDNASFFHSDKGEYKEEPLRISGTLNKESTYYFTGEPISTRLTLVSGDPQKKSVRLHWNLYDFFGRKAASSEERTIPLQNGRAETELRLTPPPNLRGAMNWEIVADGAVHNYYLGIIDKPEKPNPRLGVNLARHNTRIGMRYLKDFRYSAVRIWEYNGMVPGFDLIEPYHKNGFYVLFCLNRAVPEQTKRHLFPKDTTSWQQELRKIAARFKGMVDAYEIINEPNALAGRAKNPDPEKYDHITPESNAKIIRDAAEAIRPIDPAAKIAGPTTCKTDLAWTGSVLAYGAWKDLDILTEHPYLTLPELPDYAETLAAMKKDAEKHGKKYPLFATERGTMVPANPADNRFFRPYQNNTAKIIRTMLIGFAGGSEKFFDFSFGTGNYAVTYNMVLSGNPDNHYLPKPGYGMYAAKAMADRIENAPMVRQVKLGLLYRCYLFDHGTKRTAAIWKWNGPPEKISFKRKFDIYDFMGTRTTADSFELSEFPCYVESTLPLDSFAEEIAKADLKTGSDRMQVSVNVRSSRQFSFDIRNITGKTIPAGTVRILNGATEQKSLPCPAIPPEGATAVLFNTRRPIGLSPRPLSAEIGGRKFEFQLKGITAAYLKKKPVLDGDLREWKQIPPILLTAEKNAFAFRPWNMEEKKSRAELRFAWNKDGFYMAVTVWKKGFHPVDMNGPTGTWRGDGLQIAMDPLKNALPGSGYQDDDFEYDAAMFLGKPLVNRQRGSLAIHDSLSKKLGPVDDVQCAIAVKPDHVTYELAFHPFAVSPFRLVAGNSMRISVIANLNDGKDRIGYLQLTPGLGSAKKNPSEFIDIFLEQEKQVKK